MDIFFLILLVNYYPAFPLKIYAKKFMKKVYFFEIKLHRSIKILFFSFFIFYFLEKNHAQNFSLPVKKFSENKNHVRGEILFQMNKKLDVERWTLEKILNPKSTLRPSMSDSVFQKNISVREIGNAENIFALKFDENVYDENENLKSLQADTAVKWAQFNYFVEARSTTPNDSLYNRQWYLRTMKAAQAWDFGTGGITPCGDTIVVAVIDRGIDATIKEFAPNLWKNKKEIPNNGLDDDGNGYVDDYVGYNFFSGNDDHTQRAQDVDIYHGTWVAGLIGAAGNNKIGIAGVNWNIKLMILSGVTNEGNIIDAYNYVLKMRRLYNQSGGKSGAFVVATSMSLGLMEGQRPENHPIWCGLYDKLGVEGILNFVAAINTDGDVSTTGDIPTLCASDYLLSINHTDSLDKFVFGGYSTKFIAFSAPGADIITTSASNIFETIGGGNSLATPLAAGSAALLYNVRGNLCNTAKTNPLKAAQQVRDAIINGVDKIPNLAGKSRTGGRLNLYNSVQQILSGVETISNKSLSVYPNPMNASFTIVLPHSATEANLTFYDAAGRYVKSQKVGASGGLTENISVSEFPNGFYSILIIADNVFYRHKIIIVH